MFGVTSRVLILATALLLSWLPRAAQATITLKFGSLAPEGTIWDDALQEMAGEWSEITKGEVTLKIYAGGVAGNETVMLRKIRIGQLHGASMTNLGLVEIEPSAQVTATPMLIRSYEEYDYVMDNMLPIFEQRIEANGFIPLSWSDAGWVHLFTKTKMTSPGELSKHKFFAWEGDPIAVKMYQVGGLNPVVVASTDVLPSLQSGLINAFPSTPLGALALKWFGVAPHMLDIPWSPLTAITVMSADAWNLIPEKYHDALRESARRHGKSINEKVRKQDVKSIEIMKRYGLKVHTIDDATRAAWEQTAKKAWPIARESWVPTEVFDQTEALLKAYRSEHP